MKILIAVDGSSSSDAVVQEAAFRPWPAGSEFSMVAALDPFFFTRAPVLLEEAKRSTMQALEETAEPLKKAGWRVSTEMALENPRRAIPRIAGEWKAELILLGSHGKGAFGRLLLGSTAQAVLRHSTCSVEIVRGGKTEAGGTRPAGLRILVPTDGSESAQGALRAVADRPWPNGSEAKVISTPEYPILLGEAPYYPPNQVGELTKVGDVHAKACVENGIALLGRSALQVTGEITEPHETPARAILSAAERWPADLIVVGSHGRRGFDRLMLGSVSETVALHAHVSVEVVREGAGR
jgi:nucleotide-binding universal stress UspA family protein